MTGGLLRALRIGCSVVLRVVPMRRHRVEHRRRAQRVDILYGSKVVDPGRPPRVSDTGTGA
jgi:hypothetical protein